MPDYASNPGTEARELETLGRTTAQRLLHSSAIGLNKDRVDYFRRGFNDELNRRGVGVTLETVNRKASRQLPFFSRLRFSFERWQYKHGFKKVGGR